MNDTLFGGDDAALLADSVDHFLADHYRFERRRKRLAAGPADRGCWPQMAELGWLGLPFAETFGGFGGSWLDVALLMQRFGRALVVEPYLANVVLAGGLLARLGSPEQQQRWLPALIEGRTQWALAYAEPGARHDWHRVRTLARPARNGSTALQGRKSLVWGGASADAFIVLARDSDAAADVSLFVIERGQAGLRAEPFVTIDGHAAAELELDAVAAPERLGPRGSALPAVARVIDDAAALSCAEGIGVLEALFDGTLEYLKQRQQFGRALASNQALQHRLVDMHSLLRECEGVARFAVQALADGDQRMRNRAVSLAKVHVGQALRHIGQEAVQLHGAIGTTDEFAISHHFKRATALSLMFGDVDHHRARLAQALREEHAPRAEAVTP